MIAANFGCIFSQPLGLAMGCTIPRQNAAMNSHLGPQKICLSNKNISFRETLCSMPRIAAHQQKIRTFFDHGFPAKCILGDLDYRRVEKQSSVVQILSFLRTRMDVLQF